MNRQEHTNRVLLEIAMRRTRHSVKYDSEHDDQHTNYELRDAAGAFLGAHDWPFIEPFKARPTYRENLIESAALIVAEIERLDRRGHVNL